MSNEKDNATAADLMHKWIFTDCRDPTIQLTRGALANLEIKVADALTTVRREERETALETVRRLAPPSNRLAQMFHKRVIAAMEAAAATEEGERRRNKVELGQIR